jgi:hypothetical protein
MGRSQRPTGTAMKTNHSYELRLTSCEAVVLFELLHRVDHGNGDALRLDAAEREVTHNLIGLLEGAIAERVDDGYLELVAEAKERLTGIR